MISTGESTRRLGDTIYNASSIDEIRQIINELRRCGLSEPEAGSLVDYLSLAFSSVRRLTAGSPRQARSVIIGELLPLCLQSKAERPGGEGPNPFPGILRSWLDELPAKDRIQIRRKVLDGIRGELDGARIRESILLIDTIAYRDASIVRALRRIIKEHDDEIGDIALATLAKLGVRPRDKERLIAELTRRIKARWNHPLSATAKRLPDVRVLERICHHWFTAEKLRREEDAKSWLPMISVPLIATIAEAFPADTSLQYLAWRRLRLLTKAISQTLDSVLHYDSRFTRIDSAEIVRYHLENLGEKDPKARYLSYTRLEECVRPHQINGWAWRVPASTLGVLSDDACMATGMEGAYSTLGLQQKTQAWSVLLSLGRTDPPAVDRALRGERNGFAISEVLEIAACLRNDPLPSIVARLLTSPHGEIPDEENQRISAHVSAIHVAHSSCSEDAFRALLAFEPVTRGGVLLSLIGALADIASVLKSNGITTPIEELWRSTSSGNPPHRRAAAAAALARLVGSRDVQGDMAPQIFRLSRDPQLDPYARRNLLEAIGHLPRGTVPPIILQEIRLVARVLDKVGSTGDGVAETPAFGAIALAVLARHGGLADDEELLQACLGLSRAGAAWEIGGKVPHANIASHVIGILFADDPERFAPAVSQWLRTDDLDALYLLAPWIQRVGRAVPSIVIDALFDRVKEMSLGRISEPRILSLIALTSPERLVSIARDEIENWLPEARSDLADALWESGPLDPEMTGRRADLLLRLMGDGQFRVRRSAYRAMARIDHPILRNICISWASTYPSAEVRERAAEASGWLVGDRYPLPISRLAWDPEPSVRDAFGRSQSGRRERLYAEEYLEHVLSVRDPAEVVPAWRYGEALARTGDDRDLEIIEKRAADSSLPPSIRFWLHRIRENLRKRWDRAVEKWSDPSYTRRGRLEVVEGTLVDRNEKAKPFKGYLWYDRAEEPAGVCSWGGWTVSTAISDVEHTIKIPGRREAKVHVLRTSYPDGPTIFNGNGPFPIRELQ